MDKPCAPRTDRFHFMRSRFPFSGNLLARRAVLALGLSIASVIGLAVFEWLVLDYLGRAPFSEPAHCSILQYSPAQEAGPSLLVYRTCNGKPDDGMRYRVELSTGQPGRNAQEYYRPEFAPHCAVRLGKAGKVALGSLSGAIYTWDASHPEDAPVPLTTHPGASVTLAADAAGQTLVVANEELISAWDVASRRLRWSRNDLLVSSNVRISTSAIVCGTRAGEILELDLATGATLRCLARHQGIVACVDLSPDGATLASIGADRRLLVTDCRTLETLWSQPHSALAQVCFSPEGKTLISSGFMQNNWMLMAWNVASGETALELRGHESVILGMIFDNRDRLYSWSCDGTIRVWDMRQGQQIDSYTPTPNC